MQAEATPTPPGPKGHFILGNVLQIKRDPLGFLAWCGREYGDIVRLRIANKTGYLINNPDYIENVLVTNSQNFIKPPGREPSGTSEALFGEEFMSSDGDFWMRHRKFVQPALHRQRIHSYADVMVDYTRRLLDTWRDGETRDIYPDIMQLTLKIIARTLFSTDASADVGRIAQALDVIMREITSRMVNPFQIPPRIPTPANVRFRNSTAELNNFIASMLARHKEEQIQDDLLAMLVEARGEDGDSISDYQWRYEVMTLFIAGYETVALALTWGLYLLSQNPEVESKLVAELQSVLGGRPPSADDYPKLVYTEMVVKEALRLYPPVWFIGARVALTTCRLGPYEMPAGSIITMSPWVTHQDPRFFKGPARFDPERWAGDTAKQIPKYSYFPFGGGVRLCIGYAYAMMEAVLVLATLVQSCHYTLLPGHPATPQPLITLRPKFGMKMILSKRFAAANRIFEESHLTFTSGL